MNEHREIPIYTNDSSLNIYQNELMNLLAFLKEVHPAFLIDKMSSAETSHTCETVSSKVLKIWVFISV